MFLGYFCIILSVYMYLRSLLLIKIAVSAAFAGVEAVTAFFVVESPFFIKNELLT